MSGDTSSPAVVDWVQTQLGRCLGTHSRCRLLEDPVFPTRLVSVKAFNDCPDVVLVHSSEVSSSSKYIALSHCWGKYKMQCLTTASTYDQQLRRIPWQSLTRSFQDAVDFTRRLGIGYIWIDSICIVQGDKADWLREARNMLSIYKNALATIVNVHAEDGSKGLYWQNVGRKPVQRRLATFHSWFLPHLPPEAPAFTRAWCYQERLISPRVVYFTREEVLWECFTETACECSVIPVIDVDNPKINYIAAFLEEEHDELRTDVMVRTIQPSFNLSSTSGVKSRDLTPIEARRQYRVKQWHNIVEQYSELEITNVVDRLPALGAVAKHFKQVRKGERYLAGLWSGSLVDDLLWFPTLSVRHRLHTWVAPSWSWASVSGDVQYHPTLSNCLAKVISAECQYEENDPFVFALSGSLTLESSVIPFRLREIDETNLIAKQGAESSAEGWFLLHEAARKEFHSLGKIRSDGETDSEGDDLDDVRFFLDDPNDPLLENRKLILAVMLGETTEETTQYLLLVRSEKTDNRNEPCFVRIGMMNQSSTGDVLRRALCQDEELKTFTIV